MLRHTFCHLPGVGPKTELGLWNAGVHTWEEALAQCLPNRPFAGRCWPTHLEASLNHYKNSNPGYFSAALPSNQTWRLFKDFCHSCVYLDIETTGLGGPGDHITTVALYDGQRLRTYVHGINLDDFPRDIQDYKLIVTYNGATFDLPFLERQFHIKLNHAHIDLRYTLKSLGLSGGLKRCEQMAGIDRPGLEEVDGYAAVLLWQEYQRRRDSKALETLLAYNVQDTVNLERLMILAYNRKVAETPFAAQHRLPEAKPAANPFFADPGMVARVAGGGWRLMFRR